MIVVLEPLLPGLSFAFAWAEVVGCDVVGCDVVGFDVGGADFAAVGVGAMVGAVVGSSVQEGQLPLSQQEQE